MYKWDSAAINSNTRYSRLSVESAKEYVTNVTNDPRKDQRLERQECPACFYRIRMCGQGFTAYGCRKCGDQFTWHNTCIPKLCLSCAKDASLCQHCAADVDLKTREAQPRK